VRTSTAGQRLAVAWRLAADLDARGEFAWVPRTVQLTTGLAYRGVIDDGNSRWEKLTGPAASVVEALPGRREIDELVARRGPLQRRWWPQYRPRSQRRSGPRPGPARWW
jgi:hypothetical protein